APRLLRVDEVEVDVAGVLQRPPDRVGGDLVEHHAPHRHARLQDLDEVPADRLALAVLVRRDVDLVGLLEGGLEAAHDLALAGRHDVDGLEALLDVHAQARPALLADLVGDLGGGGGEVPDVTHARLHLVARGPGAAGGARLRGWLDDHEAAWGSFASGGQLVSLLGSRHIIRAPPEAAREGTTTRPRPRGRAWRAELRRPGGC